VLSGPLIVLFVNTSDPAIVAKSLSVNAVLNSAVVPVIVFVVNDIDLLVNVSAEDSVTIEPSVDKTILLLSIAVLIPEPPTISKLPPKLKVKLVEVSSPIVIVGKVFEVSKILFVIFSTRFVLASIVVEVGKEIV